MADAQNKLKLQRAHATNALNYGHLGNATYAESSTVWTFMRDEQGRQLHHPAYAFPFEIVGSEFEASQSEITGETAILNTGGEKLTPHGGLRLVAEELYEITHKQYRNANSIPFNDGSFDRVPHKGQLAFGSAAVILDNGKSRQTVPIAALVSGITAEAVRILLIGKKNFQTVDAHGLHNYQLPTISYDEEAYWSSEGDPVQQVCFAATCDSETTQSTWMATRCRSGTTIFHPLFYRAYMTLGMSATRLSPNPILRIPMSRTGGHPHADVAFHPYDHKLLAIVDVHGSWSVWKIEIPRRPVTGRVLYGIHLRSIGRLFTDVKLLSLNGDWHKICWISHTATKSDRLMVSSRSHAALFDSSGHNLGDLDLRTGGPKENQLVLDIEQSSTNPMECYFLTSTKLLLMSAAESDQANSTGQEQMIMLLSWSHYRGRTDSSLRLVLAETAQATTTLITSINNGVVTAFRTGLPLENCHRPVSLADPFHFNLLKAENIAGCHTYRKLLAFRNLQIQSKTGQVAKDEPVLFKAFFGRPGTRPEELLYRCTDNIASTAFRRPFSTAIPLPITRTLQRKSARYAESGGLGDFVVAEKTTLWLDRNEPSKPSQPLFKDPREEFENTPHTSDSTDWQYLYVALVDTNVAPPNEARSTEVAVAIEGLNAKLQNYEIRPNRIQTLREMLDVKITYTEFEAANRAFTSLTTDFPSNKDQQSHISQLEVPEVHFNSYTASDTHDQLNANWIVPLPHGTDNRTRLMKDRLIRSVAADLALSSITIGPLPNIMVAATRIRPPSIEHLGLGDLSPSPAGAVNSLNIAPEEDPACSRLRRFGPLAKPILAKSASRVLTDMLAHLPTAMDADPSDYSWRVTEARLASENSAEGAEKLDRKAQRRAERSAALQRKRLESQKQVSQVVEQSLAPPAIWSSHRPAVREVQSSQIGPVSREDPEISTGVQVSMTQPARGTFGSRTATIGQRQGMKKKSRKEGF